MTKEIEQDLTETQVIDTIDVSGVVSPFEIPQTEIQFKDPLLEKLDKCNSFAIQKKHALQNHYPLRNKRSSQIEEYPASVDTHKRNFSKRRAISLEEADLASPDPNLSMLAFEPPKQDEAQVFIAASDLQEIARITGMKNAEIDEDGFDPEVVEVLMEDLMRGKVGGEEPTLYDDMICSDISHKDYPIEDSYEPDSRP